MSLRFACVAARFFDAPLMVDRRKLPVLSALFTARMGLEAGVIAGADGSTRVPALGVAGAADDFLPEPPPEAPTEGAAGSIAVIRITGSLAHRVSAMEADSGAVDYDMISNVFQAALADPGVKGIMLDIHSPGGEVSGAFTLAQEIYAARDDGIKPIIAVANDLAASAAYLIASAADRVFVTRTGEVGSIGVVALHLDRSGEMEKKGWVATLIYAGAHKVEGNEFEPLDAKVRDKIQAEVDSYYALFVADVAKHRGLSTEAVRATEAATYIGQAAVDVGLADGIATPREALAAFSQRLGL